MKPSISRQEQRRPDGKCCIVWCYRILPELVQDLSLVRPNFASKLKQLTSKVGDFSEAIVGRIGMKAGSKLVLFAGGNLLKDFSKPLQQEVPERSFEISYVFQQVCALEAATVFRRALTDGTKQQSHITVINAISALTFGTEFNQSLDGVTLPNSLQTLTFGDRFNQSLDGVTLSLIHI